MIKKARKSCKPYVRPECRLIQTDLTQFVCNSVLPHQGFSHVENYDWKEANEVGLTVVGDASTLAPAKGNPVWEEEED